MVTVYVDIETGGMNPETHPITQIAAVAVDAFFKELSRFEVKLEFDPNTAEPEALGLNSYDPGIWLEEAISPRRALAKFAHWLELFRCVHKTSSRGNNYLVSQLAGYNAHQFDGPFLMTKFKQYDMFFPADRKVLDVMHLFMWRQHLLGRSMEKLKLTEACLEMGVDLKNAHDAMGDILATVELAKRLTKETHIVLS